MKLISWNVNGLRAVLKKGFGEFIKRENPDILCLQEIRANPDQAELNLSDYHQFWNPAEKKGYSGTLILSKIKPLSAKNGIGVKSLDNEGRVITLEFEDCCLITVYTPNAGRELKRLDYRMNWDREFLKYLKKTARKKPIILCGDTNVAHKEIDLKNPDRNHRNAGFTDEERDGFSKILAAGFIDTFREFNQEGGHYTWWSYRSGARKRNIGWRIDYFCISNRLRDRLNDAFILSEILGSDHCPVGISFD